MPGFFITGTDTDVGKTLFSAALLKAASLRGWRTIGLKPVAAGCEESGGGLRNSDALLLQSMASQYLDYQTVNPVSLAPAIAPHIAASEAGRTIEVEDLVRHCRPQLAIEDRLVLVEGAGGWRVPLNRQATLADLAVALELPVILVVGLKLGCINHALLSAEAIANDGLKLAGWVANAGPEPMARQEQNICSLEGRIAAPCIARLPWFGAEPDLHRVGQYIKLDVLLAAS